VQWVWSRLWSFQASHPLELLPLWTNSGPCVGFRASTKDLDGQREALFLRFYLDFDYAAIAEALEVEIGTVSATLHAAREGLGRALMEVRT
jgi:hypothetical protein